MYELWGPPELKTKKCTPTSKFIVAAISYIDKLVTGSKWMAWSEIKYQLFFVEFQYVFYKHFVLAGRLSNYNTEFKPLVLKPSYMMNFDTLAAPRGLSHTEDLSTDARDEILGWVTLPNYPEEYAKVSYNSLNPPFLGIILDIEQFRLRS